MHEILCYGKRQQGQVNPCKFISIDDKLIQLQKVWISNGENRHVEGIFYQTCAPNFVCGSGQRERNRFWWYLSWPFVLLVYLQNKKTRRAILTHIGHLQLAGCEDWKATHSVVFMPQMMQCTRPWSKKWWSRNASVLQLCQSDSWTKPRHCNRAKQPLCQRKN